MRRLLSIFLVLVWALPAAADEFDQISSEQAFVSLVEGRKLVRFGIDLDVTSEGKIVGRAFGREVTGQWDWKSGYFCRDLYWGSRDLGANCQAVRVQGDTIRFVSDQGTGRHADLRLR